MTENVVDPADFVGEPPAGDAHPGDFMSNDQSDPGSVTPTPASDTADSEAA